VAERFFVEQPITGERVVLRGAEAHHLLHVLRARVGREVVLFDGSGAEFTAVVGEVGREKAVLRIAARREIDRELPFSLILAVALPKGDRQKWLVEKTVELGVGRLVALHTERTIVRPSAAVLARLHRTVIEAAKQCGRNRLMELALAEDWTGFVVATGAMPCRLLAHPVAALVTAPATATPAASGGLAQLGDCGAEVGEIAEMAEIKKHLWQTPPQSDKRKEVLVAVGPEGGFTPAEVELALSAGWRHVDLGPRLLRVETAALAMAAVLAVPP
jgi:16S rRNA (uracil1498-N3)-methyltransferase